MLTTSCVRISGPEVNHASVHAIIAQMSAPGFWDSGELRAALSGLVPAYRLSKFQFALPDREVAEMVGAYQLDFEGAAIVVSSRS